MHQIIFKASFYMEAEALVWHQDVKILDLFAD